MMKKKILKTIAEHNLIKKDMHIVLGLSGGPDSVCLFNVLLDLSDDLNLTIHPVHVNHKFRPKAAEEDQEYVEELCRKKGLVCRSFTVDCNEMARTLKLTSEEAGRKARYDAFYQVAEEVAASGIPRKNIAIAVAQNSNDQCETILFRILRGTGTDGLSGIAYKRKGDGGFNIIRPLLDIGRDEIEKYCESCNLQPRIDYTNSEPIYTRNKIRLKLIPFLVENFNNNIVETINRLGKISSEDKDFIWQEANKVFDRIGRVEKDENFRLKCEIFTEDLEELHTAVRFRVYNICLTKVGMHENITRAHLEAVEQIRLSNSPSSSADMADGFRVSKAYDRLIFYREEFEELLERQTEWKLHLMTKDQYKDFAENARKQGILYGSFSGDLISEMDKLKVRARQDGDYIAINGADKIINKKLQDFFVDCKVPKLYRDKIQMLAFGNKILWVLPSNYFPNQTYKEKGRFSADFKADPERDETIIVLERKLNLC